MKEAPCGLEIGDIFSPDSTDSRRFCNAISTQSANGIRYVTELGRSPEEQTQEIVEISLFRCGINMIGIGDGCPSLE